MALKRVPLITMAASAAVAVPGLVLGSWGSVQMVRAKSQMRHDKGRYDARHSLHIADVARTNQVLQVLGNRQEQAQRDVIFRMRDFLERHNKQVLVNEPLVLDGVDAANNRVVGLAKLEPDLASWVRGVAGAVTAGVGTPIVIKKAITKYAQASTGTAISGLHGAAANNATFAFLGGGSLESGGHGIKLGKPLLTVAAISPSALILGITMKNEGTKARARAEEFRTQVDIEIAEFDKRTTLLHGVRTWARELDETVARLAGEAATLLDALEAEVFDLSDDLHAKRLQAALILVKSVRDVATAAVADEAGNLDQNVEQLVFTYREAKTEAPDVGPEEGSQGDAVDEESGRDDE